MLLSRGMILIRGTGCVVAINFGCNSIAWPRPKRLIWQKFMLQFFPIAAAQIAISLYFGLSSTVIGKDVILSSYLSRT